MTQDEEATLIQITRTGAELIRLLKGVLEAYGDLPDRLAALEAEVAILRARLTPNSPLREKIFEEEIKPAIRERLTNQRR